MLLTFCGDTSLPKRRLSLSCWETDGPNPGVVLCRWPRRLCLPWYVALRSLLERFGDSFHCRAEWPRDQCAPPYYPKFRNGWEPPAELFLTAPWETEGPSGQVAGQLGGQHGPPFSPEYRQHSTEDVGVFVWSSLNIWTISIKIIIFCVFCFLVLWNLFLKLVKWVNKEDFLLFLKKRHEITKKWSLSFDSSYNEKPNNRKFAKIRYNFVARSANELSVLQDEILEVVMTNSFYPYHYLDCPFNYNATFSILTALSVICW